MITATITDSTASMDLPALEVPLTIETLEGSNDVTTLDNNVRTDFTNPKRLISIQYDSLTESEFNQLKGFYDRQFSLFEYPTLTIDHYGIEIDARMNIAPRQVYDHCGSVEDVTVTFRESIQLPVVGSS